MRSISEAILRVLWQERRYRMPLITCDGLSVDVLDPGILNTDGGPDFTNAFIRIGGTLYRGDVEIHTDAGAWHQHGHHTDSHYNSVVLHVALQYARSGRPIATQSGRAIPLVLLDIDPQQIDWTVLSRSGACCSTMQALPCSTHNEELSPRIMHRWLHTLAVERLLTKTRRIEERLKELLEEKSRAVREPRVRFIPPLVTSPPTERVYSRDELADPEVWDQLFYEGIMDSLGFGKNRQPMQSLARIIPLTLLRRYGLHDTFTMEALLLGTAGLLPKLKSVNDKGARAYVRLLRRQWRAIRASLHTPLLHESEWLFFRLRPVNFPTARLAVMAGLCRGVFSSGGFNACAVLARKQHTVGWKFQPWKELLVAKTGSFWETHCSFKEGSGHGGTRLGPGRIVDMVVNVIVPLLLVYACACDDRSLRRAALRLFAEAPLLQENFITRRMEHALIRKRLPIRNAVDQQALLQLHNHYCIRERCAECPVNRLNGVEPVHGGPQSQIRT